MKIEPCLVLHRSRVRRTSLLFFLLGLLLGLSTPVPRFYADAQELPLVVVRVGEYLCRQWDGVSAIRQEQSGIYSFRCNSLAVFPLVPISVERR